MIMRKHCGNCAVYDRKNMKHSELCGKCVTEHFPNGKESDPSMWKPLYADWVKEKPLIGSNSLRRNDRGL